MAYTADTRGDGLDALTTLATNDLLIAADFSDSFRAKKITKANFMTDIGAVNASETVKGLVEEATDAEVIAGTATGATGAKLFVTPAKLATNIPSLAGGNMVVSMTAGEDITIGTPVGISNNIANTVARADRKSSTATYGFTASTFAFNTPYICPIGGDKFIFISNQASDDSLYATVGSVDPDTLTVTVGTSLAATADINEAVTPTVCKLDTDKFIVFYTEDASAVIVKCRVATVSGTTITYGAAATFFTGGTNISYTTADFISTDKGICVIKCATGTDSRAVAFTVSGTTVTAGTPQTMGANTNANVTTKVKKIGTDKFVIFALEGTGYVQVGTLSGTDITLGSEVNSGGNGGSDETNTDIVSPATDVFVLRYSDVGTQASLIAATVSGTVPTFGTELTSQFNEAGGLYEKSASLIYASTGSSTNDVHELVLSGNTLSNNGIIIRTGTYGYIMGIDNGYYIIGNISGTTLTVWIENMSNNFIGIAQATVLKSASVNVLYRGKDTNQSNLI